MSDIQVRNINNEAACTRPGFFSRLLWLFISPGKLMKELAEKPRVLFWIIAGALVTALPFLIRMPLYEDMIRKTVAAQSDYMESFGFEMTPEMIEASLPGGMIGGLVGMPFEAAGGLVLIALLFFAVLKIMGGEGKYKAYLSVIVYANIITVLYFLLLIPVSYLTGSLYQTAPITSLATLASPDAVNPWIYGLLAGIDVFAIWKYSVMAIGFSAVSRLKKSHVYTVTAIIFIIGLIIKMAGMPAALKLLQ